MKSLNYELCSEKCDYCRRAIFSNGKHGLLPDPAEDKRDDLPSDYWYCYRHKLDTRTPEDHRLHEDPCSHFPAPLREDALYLAQAAKHLADHATTLNFECEDLDNVQHFAAKIIAAIKE